MIKPFRPNRVFKPASKPKERTGADKIRSSAAWQRCRLNHIKRFPMCQDPLGKHKANNELPPMGGREVHHKIPIEQNPDLAFDDSNLLTVCRYCHESLEKRATIHLEKPNAGARG